MADVNLILDLSFSDKIYAKYDDQTEYLVGLIVTKCYDALYKNIHNKLNKKIGTIMK
jgi:hypothetical protein